MTNEELDEARGEEALQRLVDSGQLYCQEDIATLAARLARESWTPPKPVDPDVLAFREWAANKYPNSKATILKGGMDATADAVAYLAGARMAREQERERATGLVAFVHWVGTLNSASCGPISVNPSLPEKARITLAKYEEGRK